MAAMRAPRREHQRRKVAVMDTRIAGSTQSRQAGAYAVEFAMTFLLVFAVFYVVLSFAFIFAAQQVLNAAADDAARAGLRWRAMDDAAAREQDIRNTASHTAGWLRRMVGDSALQTHICDFGTLNVSPICVAAFRTIMEPEDGSPPVAQAGLLGVVVRYDYRQSPIVPVPGPDFLFGVIVPERLDGKSLVQRQVGMLPPVAGFQGASS